MSTTELLMIGPLHPHVMSELDSRYKVHRYWEADDKSMLLDKIKSTVKGIVTDGHLGASAELQKQLPNCKIISSYGVGYDAVDVVSAKELGINVTNTPGVLNDDVADYAIGIMLAVFRNICAADKFIRAGKWTKGMQYPLGRKFTGSKLGILGLGRIGSTVAKRAQAFDLDISYVDVNKRDDVDYTFYSDLKEMAAAVDILLITTTGGPSTHKLVNKDIFQALGEKGVLINVSRGTVVNEADLADALLNKTISGAGLDVFYDEPNIPAPLLKMDNVVLQPHAASATHETRLAMGQLVIDNLDNYFAGKELLTPVV